MDSNSCSFFPLLQDDEFSILCPYPTVWDVGLDDRVLYCDVPKDEGIYFENNKKGKLPEKLKENQGGSDENQELQRKRTHRDIERQRRQEMATLYASLRSVLPPHYLKGKRSVSDQINEAAKYIRNLQNDIRELRIKRDNIKRLCRNESFDSEEGSSGKNLPIVVRVERCSVGVEVLISGDFMAEGLILLPLSRILHLLLEEGLIVVSCNYTKDSDGKLHYVIQSEAHDYPGVNLQMLQRKLVSMINTLMTDVKL